LDKKFSQDNHVQAVLRTLAIIDLEPLREAYRGTGSKPYPPERLLAISLFEILSGVSSPSAWHHDANTREQCTFLGRGVCPSRSVWYDFRDRCAKFIDSVHQSLVGAAIKRKQIEPTECALDGTFTAAASSRHEIFNLRQINRRLSKLKRAVQSRDDPNQIASSKPLPAVPLWIAKTPAGRLEQLSRFYQAKQRILENIAKNRTKPKRYQRDEDRILISPADIDAVIGKDKKKVVRPLFNTQLMTDCRSDVIVAYEVYSQNNDNGTLAPMIKKSQAVTGNLVETVHADSGYCSILDLKDCGVLEIDLYAPVQDNTAARRKLSNGEIQIPSIEFEFDELTRQMTCPAGHEMKFVKKVQVARADGRTLGELRFEQSANVCSGCELASRCFESKSKRRSVSRQSEQHILDAQKEKMASAEGLSSQRLRAQVVERRFADGKQHRNQDVQNGRGLTRVRAEVGLLVVAQNTLTLYNLEKRGAIGFD